MTRTQHLIASIGFIWGLGLASIAAADGLLYECDITDRNPRVDWISTTYAFVVQDRGVTVIDPVILSFMDTPVVTQPRKRAKGFLLRWTVAAEDAKKTVARMSYRAELNTQAKTVTVRVTPVGFPQGWSGRGSCKTRRK